MNTLPFRCGVRCIASLVSLACAVAFCAQEGPQPAGSQPAQDRPADLPQSFDRAQSFSEREVLALESAMQQLQEQRARLADEIERTRSVVRMLEEQLRQARLEKVDNEDIERVKAEYDNNLALLKTQEDQYKALAQQMLGIEMQNNELRAKISAQQAEREQVARQREMEAAEKRRQDAEQQAATIYRDVAALAQLPDSATALYEALRASEVQQLQAQYAGLQERLAQLEQLYQRGAISQTELSDTKTQAATVLAKMRQATIQSMIEQVEREREGFAQRNDPLRGEVSGQMLQTEFFRGYLDTVQRYSQLSRDPADAAVAAVVTAADLLRSQGPKASIEYFKPILEELSRASDPASSAAEAAVRMQLAEAYHAAGQDADALQVLRTLIVRRGAADKAPE